MIATAFYHWARPIVRTRHMVEAFFHHSETSTRVTRGGGVRGRSKVERNNKEKEEEREKSERNFFDGFGGGGEEMNPNVRGGGRN